MQKESRGNYFFFMLLLDEEREEELEGEERATPEPGDELLGLGETPAFAEAPWPLRLVLESGEERRLGEEEVELLMLCRLKEKLVSEFFGLIEPDELELLFSLKEGARVGKEGDVF